MEYRSPFEGLDFFQNLEIDKEKSLQEMLDILARGIDSSTPIHEKIYFNFCPAEIIRSLLEYKISNPESADPISLIQEAVKASLDFYNNPTNSSNFNQLSQLIETIMTENDRAQLQHQVIDKITWQATDPAKSRSTANRLANMSQDNLLVIALAQGGIPSGLDVFSYYRNITNSKNSIFYPIRYSRKKLNDAIPQISRLETVLLQNLAEDRQPIIFDEDLGSGQTVTVARACLRQILPGKTIRTATNFDPNRKLTTSGFLR